MALTVTSVNGGLGRVVFGANGRPAHIIELGPVYIRLDVSDGFDTLDLPAGGGLVNGSFAMATMNMYIAGAHRRHMRRRGAGVYVNSVSPGGGLALGVPA